MYYTPKRSSLSVPLLERAGRRVDSGILWDLLRLLHNTLEMQSAVDGDHLRRTLSHHRGNRTYVSVDAACMLMCGQKHSEISSCMVPALVRQPGFWRRVFGGDPLANGLRARGGGIESSELSAGVQPARTR